MAYELAVDSWSDNLTIDIVSSTDTFIASIPLAFVQNGGDNTWQYILHVMSMLVNVQGAAGRFLNANDTAVDMDERPSAGRFKFITGCE